MRKVLLTLSLLIISSAIVMAQRTVSGTVTSGDDGSSIPGVNVVLKGTTTGTVSDIDGNYSILLPSDEGVLVFSFIGYASQEIDIGNQTVINVTMEAEITQLSEIVIPGYSETTRKKLVSSVAIVDNANIENVPMPNIDQIIQGRAPGVYTTAPSGQPGAVQDVRIRGTGSITAGRGPLYVIDGIIVEQGDFTNQVQTNDVLANINPNDIANITVLKDASATALYGARGANGVILISTKQGSVGKTKINARVQYGQTEPILGNFDMMSGEEQWNYEREILTLNGLDPDASRPRSMIDDGTFDWLDAAFDTGTTELYEISADGGNEKTRFFLSGGYFKQDGTLIESNFERFSVRSNLQHTASDIFEVGLNFNVSYVESLNAVAGNRFQSPLAQAFTHTGMQSSINPATGKLFTGLEPEFQTAVIGDNFLYSQPLNPTINDNLRTLGKFYATLKLTDFLKFTQNVGVDFIAIKELDFDDPTTNDGFSPTSAGGQLDKAYSENITITSQSLFNFDYQINEEHAVDGVVGFEFQDVNFDAFTASGQDVASGKLKTLNSFANPNFVSGIETEYSFVSYLMQANYNFRERYFFTGSVRSDGSSRFSADNRFATFWSVGASWRFVDESFMDSFNFLTDGRLRLSTGTTGNASIGNFASRGLYSFDVDYLGNPGSRPSQIANPNLSWETSDNFNVGLDLGFINNRISLNVDWYKRTSKDLLLNVPISQTTGFGTATRNIGEMENKGIEVVLTTVNFEGEFRWTTNFNLTANRNKILKLPDGEDIPNGRQLYREGEPIRSFYMREWAGVAAADDAANNIEGGDPLWYQDVLDSDGEPTGDRIKVNTYSPATLYLVGNAEPKYLGGFDNTFSYKGITLSAFFYYAQGHKLFNSSKRFIDSDGTRFGWNHLVEAGEDFWTPTNTDATRPLPKVGGNKGGANSSTRYLEDASFVRLRNVILAYNFPKQILEKAKLQGLRVYLQGQNLWTSTDYSGFDPEADENGDEFFRYPVGASLTFGLDVTF